MVERTREWSTAFTATFPAHPFRFRPQQEQLALRPLRQKALTFVLETVDPPSLKKLTGVLLQLCQASRQSSRTVRPANKHQEVNCGKSLQICVGWTRAPLFYRVRDLDEVGSSTILPLRLRITSASFGAPPLS